MNTPISMQAVAAFNLPATPAIPQKCDYTSKVLSMKFVNKLDK